VTQEQQSENNISDEFRNLGHNLINAMRAAWDNPERKQLQQEIEAGLDEFASTVKEEVDHFNQSPTGQRIKSDIGDLQERVRSGEVETKVRDEILSALRTLNIELAKVTSNLQSEEAEGAASEEDAPTSEES
jgi:ATP:corrinoid adenosyltransferase